MTKRMLINATQSEELRVALVDGQKLYDLDIETPGKEQKKANIYKGTVTRVEPSLEAAFIEYGAERHGFLPFREITNEYFVEQSTEEKSKNIKNSLRENQEIIVQVEKEERGNKGAALTTFISLAGCYLVLMPNNPKANGISRRIEGNERSELRDALDSLKCPAHMGIIVRTAGVSRNIEELQWDLDVLLSQWHAIKNAAQQKSAPFLIYQESNALIRAIRDHLRPDISEILIDSSKIYDVVSSHIQLMRPDFAHKVKLYSDTIPLFNRFQVETQIESAFQRKVLLPSGGSIVIDHTEALISIDINSAKATKGVDIEETALQTNLEAADEAARQLRLRDIGGLIVIDFIDMTISRNQRLVEQRLHDALSMDRARVQIGRISKFGLLEMSRQRLQPALSESKEFTCPRCDGVGRIRNIENLSLNVLRLIEEEAMKENTAQIRAELPVEIATFLINEKRSAVEGIEKRQHVHVILLPNVDFKTPKYNVTRIRISETSSNQDKPASYELTTKVEHAGYEQHLTAQTERKIEQPAVQQLTPHAPAPTTRKKSTWGGIAGFFRRLWSKLTRKKPAKKWHKNNYKNKRPYRSSNYRGQNDNRSYRSNRNNHYKQSSRNRKRYNDNYTSNKKFSNKNESNDDNS